MRRREKRVRFGPMVVIESSTGAASADIFVGDDPVGEIVKDVEDVGGTFHSYRASGYWVNLWTRDDADQFFAARGNARTALATAKAYARGMLS